MLQAACAVDNLPAIPCKPGKFPAPGTIYQAAGGIIETADFVNNSCRVEKGVLVFSVLTESLFWGGDGETTRLAAQHPLLFMLGAVFLFRHYSRRIGAAGSIRLLPETRNEGWVIQLLQRYGTATDILHFAPRYWF